MKTKAMQVAFAFAVAMAMPGATAQAQGLSRATSVLTNWKAEVLTIVPIVAALALIVFAILWMTEVIRFHTLVRVGVGLLIIGSADLIVRSFMG